MPRAGWLTGAKKTLQRMLQDGVRAVRYYLTETEPSNPKEGEIRRSDGSWGAGAGLNRWDGSNWKQIGTNQRGRYFNTMDLDLFDDFIYADLSATGKWTLGSAGSGSDPVIDYLIGGEVLLDTGDTIGGTSTLSGPLSYLLLTSECRAKASINLWPPSECSLTFEAGGEPNYARAYWDGSEWILKTKDGSTENSVASGVSQNGNEWNVIELWYDEDNTKWKLLKDGTVIAETTSNLPNGYGTLKLEIEKIATSPNYADCECDYIASLGKRS